MNGRAFAGLALAGVAVGGGAYWLLHPSGFRGAGASALSVLTGSVALDAEQRRNLEVIADEFRKAGLSKWTVAAAANAYAESRLYADAAATWPEDSVGLFQLNAAGAGKGMSREDREDPRQNTRRIIDEARARGIATVQPHTEGDAVAWFAQEVERCALCGAGGSELFSRRGYADTLYGAGTSSRPFGASGGVA